jgi:hypothetical protein
VYWKAPGNSPRRYQRHLLPPRILGLTLAEPSYREAMSFAATTGSISAEQVQI